MKQGKTLSQLAAEIERQSAVKVDYLASTKSLEAVVTPSYDQGPDAPRTNGEVQLAMKNGDTKIFPIGATAHAQIADRLGIPGKYYDRMKSAQPALLATNINTWLGANPEKRMVRTLDGKVRAFLSDKYQRIDNFDIANVVLPVLSTIPGIETVSTEVTESRMYIKAISHDTRANIFTKRAQKGEMVEAGVMITNSETGQGAVSVKPYAMFLWCTNGAVIDKGMRAAHVGRKMDLTDEVMMLLSDESKAADDRAVMLKVRDVVRASFDLAKFTKWIQSVQASTEKMIEGDPGKAIEIMAETFSMQEGERVSVLRHFIEGGDLSQFGLMNAVTRTAEDLESYDRATEFETFGPSIIELPAGQWKQIATAV